MAKLPEEVPYFTDENLNITEANESLSNYIQAHSDFEVDSTAVALVLKLHRFWQASAERKAEREELAKVREAEAAEKAKEVEQRKIERAEKRAAADKAKAEKAALAAQEKARKAAEKAADDEDDEDEDEIPTPAKKAPAKKA